MQVLQDNINFFPTLISLMSVHEQEGYGPVDQRAIQGHRKFASGCQMNVMSDLVTTILISSLVDMCKLCWQPQRPPIALPGGPFRPLNSTK